MHSQQDYYALDLMAVIHHISGGVCLVSSIPGLLAIGRFLCSATQCDLPLSLAQTLRCHVEALLWSKQLSRIICLVPSSRSHSFFFYYCFAST